MTLSRVYVLGLIAAMVIATTTAAITTVLTPAAAQQSTTTTVYIVKHGSNSYTLSGGSSSVGSFDTIYRVAGERSAISSAENLIISTITDDFNSSATVGYVMVGNTTTASSTGATLPNPFASPEQITERITNELRRVITEAESGTSQGQHVEIKCDFGMSLEDMQCHYSTLPG